MGSPRFPRLVAPTTLDDSLFDAGEVDSWESSLRASFDALPNLGQVEPAPMDTTGASSLFEAWNWAVSPIPAIQSALQGQAQSAGVDLETSNLDPGRPLNLPGPTIPGQFARDVRAGLRGATEGLFEEAIPNLLTPLDLATAPTMAPRALGLLGDAGSALYRGARAIETAGGVGLGAEGASEVVGGVQEGDLARVGGGLFRAGMGGLMAHGPQTLAGLNAPQPKPHPQVTPPAQPGMAGPVAGVPNLGPIMPGLGTTPMDLRFAPSVRPEDAEIDFPTSDVALRATNAAPAGVVGAQGQPVVVPGADRRASTGRPELDAILSGLPEEQRNILLEQIRKLESDSRTDPLTGLLGKRAWLETSKQPVEGRRYVAADLKGFKAVNDQYGHGNADEGLKAIGTIWAKHFGQDKSFRPGGDEFTAYLDGVPDAEIPARLDAVRAEVGQLRVSVRMPDGSTVDLPRFEMHLGSGENAEAADFASNAARAQFGSGRAEVPGAGDDASGSPEGAPAGRPDPPQQLADPRSAFQPVPPDAGQPSFSEQPIGQPKYAAKPKIREDQAESVREAAPVWTPAGGKPWRLQTADGDYIRRPEEAGGRSPAYQFASAEDAMAFRQRFVPAARDLQSPEMPRKGAGEKPPVDAPRAPEGGSQSLGNDARMPRTRNVGTEGQSVDISGLSREVLSRMSQRLKAMGYDSRGADDVRRALTQRPNLIESGDWKQAYEAAVGTSAKRQTNAQSEKELTPNVNWTAVRKMGTTSDPREAGYIRPDGKLMDLSAGGIGQRGDDHRIVGGTAAMQELTSVGYIRWMPEANGLDIAKEPSAQQYSQIRRLAERANGEIVLDLQSGRGPMKSDGDDGYYNFEREASLQFPSGTKPEKIVGTIRRFFAGEDFESGTRYKASPADEPGVSEKQPDLRTDSLSKERGQPRSVDGFRTEDGKLVSEAVDALTPELFRQRVLENWKHVPGIRRQGNKIVFNSPSGKPVELHYTRKVVFTEEGVAKGHGTKTARQVMEGQGVVTGRKIEFNSRIFAEAIDTGSMDHEVGHVLLDHFATSRERAAVYADRELLALAKAKGSSVDEAWADWFMEKMPELRARSLSQGSILHRVAQRIYDFLLRVKDTFAPSKEGVARSAESGRIFGRKEGDLRSKIEPRFATAFHGSPHDFDRFDSSKIGTGEGAQAYGHGLYFAGAKEVAEHYREKLSGGANARQTARIRKGGSQDLDPAYIAAAKSFKDDGQDQHAAISGLKQAYPDAHVQDLYDAVGEIFDPTFHRPGKLYEVDLSPSEDDYLLWDKPLSEQSEKVKKALERVGFATHGNETGGQFYRGVSQKRVRDDVPNTPRMFSTTYGNDAAASKFLREAGIPGIKYLDGSSRGKGEGSYNYVIFDDSLVTVKAKYATKPIKPIPADQPKKGEGFGQPGGDPDIGPNINRMNVSDEARGKAQNVIEGAQEGLKREEVETWESLNPRIEQIQKTMSDEQLIKLSEKRQLDSAEVMALKQRLDQRTREFDEALSGGDPKKIGEKVLHVVAHARALANDGTDVARALNARKRLMEAGTTVDDRFLRRVFSEIKGISDKDAANLLMLYKTDSDKLPDALVAAMKPGLLRRWINFWKAGLLSAPSTDFAQTIGNTGEAGANIAEGTLAAWIDTIISKRYGKERSRFVGEAKAELGGLVESFGPALRQLKNDMVNVHKLKPVKIDVDDPRPLEHQVGAFKGTLGKISQTPFGRNLAEDRFFKSIGAHMALRKLAYRKAKGNDALAKQILREVREQGRHPELIQQAAEIARARVFQDETSGFAKGLDSLVRRFPVMEFVLPFRNAPERIAARTIERSPLGFVKAAKVFKKFEAGEATSGELADSIARPMLGTVILGTFAAVAKAGMMTGSGPTDQKQKAALRDSGWSPYSFKIPTGEGKHLYIPFNRFEPISSLLGFAADIAEAKNEKEAGDIISKGLNSLGSNLISKSYLQGLAEAAGVISRPDQALATYATEFVGSQVPNIVRRAATAIDPVIRDTKAERTGLAGLPERAAKTVASRIPGLSQTLSARKTMTGADMERSGSALTRFASPSIPSSDREDKKVEALIAKIGGDALPSTPKKALTAQGKEIKLTDEEYEVLTEGNRKATRLIENLMKRPDFQRLPDSDAEAGGRRSKEGVIQDVFRRERTKARNRVFQMSSFRTRWRQAKAQTSA